MGIIRIKSFRKIDIIAIIILVFLWSVIAYFINFPNSQLSMIFSLFITTVFIAFIGFLTKRVGAVTLFCLFGSLTTIGINNMGDLGWYKLIVLVTAGVVFEPFLLFFNKKIMNIPWSVVLGAGFASASIPFTMALAVSSAKGLMLYVLNFALMAFIIGIMGAITAFLIWHNIKTKKLIIKFEYAV